MDKQENMPSLYVGCSLTAAPKEFVEKVSQIKQALRMTEEWEVLDFLGLQPASNGQVYARDIEECIRKCDAFLAIADHPATGLGWELGVAYERNVPTLIVAKVGSQVSRLVMGSAEERSNITFERYKDIEEVPTLVHDHLHAKLAAQNATINT